MSLLGIDISYIYITGNFQLKKKD